MATIKNLVLEQGATFSANIQYLNSNKRPISLAGYNVRSKMRTSYDAANAAPFVTVITDAANGNVNLSLTAANTSSLEYGRYVYDVEAYAGNIVLRIVEGTVNVTPGVSGAQLGSLLKGDITTSDLPEGNNLYYTNARVKSLLTRYDDNIIPTVSNTYNLGSPDLRWKSLYLEATTINLGNVAISVDELTGNLTFTDTSTANNAVTLVASSIQLGTGTNAVILGANTGTLQTVLQPNSITGVEIADGSITLSKLGGINTANVPESASNLYFTPARAIASFTAGANIYISPAGVISSTGGGGNVNLAGVATEANLELKANLTQLNTSNVTESINNLYYTNARVYSNVISLLNAKANVVQLNTSNVSESTSNLYYTNARVYSNVISLLNAKANLVQLNTSNVSESSGNLYFTNARAIAAFTAGSNITISAQGVISAAGGGGGGSGTVVTADLTTANVIELASGLYYTNARTRSAISEGTGVSYNNSTGVVSIGQNVATTANVTFANLTVTGTTSFYGNVTTYSSNNLSISDNMIYLNNGSQSSNPDLGFAGNYNDGSYKHTGFFRDATDGVWKVFDSYTPEPDANIFIDTTHATFRLANLQATTFTGNVVGNVTGFVSAISNFTTSNLTEGNNLYYTNARVYSNVIGLLNVKANVRDLTTSNVVELNNLYYTNARVYSNVIGLLATKANVVDLTTSNVVELNNLYYTNARVYSNVIGIVGTKANVADLNTSNVVEGNNLYYTNARVASNVISLLTNYATTANLNLKANASQLTTGNIIELGSNVYYSNARAYSNTIALLPEYTGNIKSGNLTVGTATGGAILGANLIVSNNISVTTITANTLIVTGNPAFRVYGLGSLVGSGVTLSGGGSTTAVDYNQNSAYNSTTGIFTAPVAGYYHIFLNASFRTNTVHAQTQVAVIKNNSTTSGNILCMWEMIENYDTSTFGVSTVAYLAANDNIRAKVLMGQIMFDSNCSYGAIKIG